MFIKIKKIFLILATILIVLPAIAVLIALPFKGTQYTILRLANRGKPLASRIEDYETFAAKYPDYIPPKTKLLFLYRGLLKPEPGEEKNIIRMSQISEEILEIDPRNEKALSILIYISSINKDLDRIKLLYERLVEASPQNANYRTKLAFMYISENNLDEALEEINAAISSDPENVLAHFMAGDIYLRKEDTPSALVSYRKAAAIATGTGNRSQEANARFRLGRLLAQNKLSFDAAQELEKAAKIMPSSVPIHAELATVYFFLGLYDKTLDLLLNDPISARLWHLPQGLDYSIDDIYKARVYDMLGKIYTLKEDYIQASNYFERGNKLGLLYKEDFLDAIRKMGKNQKEVQPKVKITREDIEIEPYTPEVELSSLEDEKAKKIKAMQVSLSEADKYLSEGSYGQAITTLTSPPLNADMWELSSYYKYQVPEDLRIKAYVILRESYLGKEDFISALKYAKMAASLGAEYESGFLSSLEVTATLQKEEQEELEEAVDEEPPNAELEPKKEQKTKED